MPPKQKEGILFFFQNYPRGEGNCETTERQKLSSGNLCPATSRCLAGPTGHLKFRYFRDPPLGPPRPTESQNPLSNKEEIPKPKKSSRESLIPPTGIGGQNVPNARGGRELQAHETGTIWQIGVLTAERSNFLPKKSRFSAISHYVFSKLALWRGNCAHFRVFGGDIWCIG